MCKFLVLITFLYFNVWSFSQDTWQKTLSNKKGTIILNFSNTAVFISDESGQIKGIEYDIFNAFTNYVETKYKVKLTVEFAKKNSFNSLFKSIKNGVSGEFGAASFSITPQRKKSVAFSPKYMEDVETMITSKNFPVFKDTNDFIKYANKATFLIVPNSTFEEDYKSLRNLNLTNKTIYLNELSVVNQKISSQNNLISYTELATYFVEIKNGLKLKRQSLFKFERDGYGLILPKNSDWQSVVDEFFNLEQSKIKINAILKKHLGNDINDLLLELNTSKNGEIILLTKEKELQEIEIELNELTIKNNELEKQKTETENKLIQAKNSRDKLMLFAGLAFLSLILIFSLIAYKNKVKSNKIIAAQKADVEKQKEQIEKQHKELTYTHNEISASIKYAQRLQKAILPSRQELDDCIDDEFVLFLPRDVVSGDFYWLENTSTYKLIAVADCTGHGVPGAMVSVVCSGALNRCVKEFNLNEPKDILNKTSEIVKNTFAISGKNVRDGMDICLCAFKDDYVIFAGAYNPLWIVRDIKHITNEQRLKRSTVIKGNIGIVEYKANKQPVGLYENRSEFKQIKIKLYKGDKIYMHTDGFIDQFGGEKNKKFKSKPLKKLLISIANKSSDEQKTILENTFYNWKGECEQIDDVCILGIKI